jgi:competence protein ComEA
MKKQGGDNMKKLLMLNVLLACLLLAAPMVMQPAFAASEATAATADIIDINSATTEQLQELPGIGQVVAQRIVTYRTEHGAFTSVEDLLQVKGIGQATLAKIQSRIAVR